KTGHRHAAIFVRGEILPYPENRTLPHDATCKSDKKSGRGRVIASPSREHFVNRPARQPALKRRIGPGMTERRARRRSTAAFKAADGSPQSRKHALTCASHAPFSATPCLIRMPG